MKKTNIGALILFGILVIITGAFAGIMRSMDRVFRSIR
jgi:hypothetical protein